MQKRLDSRPAISTVDERRILELERRSIRIPSSTFEEGEIADLYASRMADIGLDDPQDPTKKSRQPIGRLRGTGAGPTLMLNGHMDPGAEMTGWTVDPYYYTSDYRVGFQAPECRVGLSWDASRSQVFSVTPRSRSLYFCTLPLSVVGSSRTNSRYRGIAK